MGGPAIPTGVPQPAETIVRESLVDTLGGARQTYATTSLVPKCALQSASMPALHRRNVPNCRPTFDGGMRKCSAVEDYARRGACPPLGSGWGVAESTMPICCTKPQPRLFMPWCAGANQHEQLL